MYSLIIAVLVGTATGVGCWYSDVFGWGWSTFFGVVGFGVTQGVIGYILQKKVKAGMNAVQEVLVDGQKKLQAKMQRWQMRPPGSIKEAQLEIARDQAVFVKKALELTEPLHRFDNWVPMMSRQIATAQLQLHWMTKNYKAVDVCLTKALFVDPMVGVLKMVRQYMLNEDTKAIEKTYRKIVKRVRYNGNVLAAAAWSWMLVQRNDVDGAFRALNEALEKSDNETLKANRDALANNRVAHFNNSGIGDQWYSLGLEEPKIHTQRQRMQWR